MKKGIPLALALVCIGGASSFAQTKDEAYFDKIAEDACECIEPMVEVLQEMKAAEEAGDETKMLEIAQESESILNKSVDCMDVLEKEYDDIVNKPEYEDELNAALKRQCPDAAKVVGAE